MATLHEQEEYENRSATRANDRGSRCPLPCRTTPHVCVSLMNDRSGGVGGGEMAYYGPVLQLGEGWCLAKFVHTRRIGGGIKKENIIVHIINIEKQQQYAL